MPILYFLQISKMAMQACRSSQLHIQEMSLKMHRREIVFGDALQRDVDALERDEDALEKGRDAEGREMGI